MTIVRKILAVLTAAERRRLRGLMLLDILTSIADIVFLALLLYVIHIYADDPAATTQIRWLPGWLADGSSLWPIGVFFLLFTIKNAVSFLIYSAQSRFRYGVASRISHRNLLLYLEGEYTQYAHTDSAKHVLKIAQQPIEFCQFVLAGYQQAVTEGTLIGMTVIAVLLFNAKLFLLLLLLLLPPVVITGWLTKKKLHAARTFIKSSRDIMWQHLQESIASYVESGLYDKKDFFANRYGDAQTILNRHLASVNAIQGAPSRLAEVFAVFGLLALIAIGHFSGNPHTAGFVTLGAFLAASYKVIPGVARLLNITGQMKTYEFTVNGLMADKDRAVGGDRDGISALVQAERVESEPDVADESERVGKRVARGSDLVAQAERVGSEPDVADESERVGKRVGTGSDLAVQAERVGTEPITAVACRHVSFYYGSEKILDDINLEIRPGDFLGICGDSGKGKTTLLNILLGFAQQENGEVLINNKPVTKAQRQQHWSHIAYVKQQPFILHDTILVNITLDENDYDEERLHAAVFLSGLDSVIDKLPGGLHARITENGKNISGGQRQRIALARALYKQADLILLDEPFSELDEASEDILLSRFARLAEAGRMIVMITHNKQSLSWCNATLSFDVPNTANLPNTANQPNTGNQKEDPSWKYASNKK